ncbi:alpha/beta hydrolase [Chelativorans sp. SCAU2101]|uniref:Palmitoyl-protein thioesterase ABHD10, mitochondrial n=1 Tax=Chelativorans petroleitrophicus TaxID=2975484 RepID=A0A9X3B5G5_9HYPH|nr:alpha/beta hydrolase [Chelativorans petroleitrophicus]MCT8989183.1 alpha/beta hydrolase [Chelativorans petroleitrophicus]
MNRDEPVFIDVGGNPIAVRHRPGNMPGLVWLGGYRSDMSGTKAAALDAWAGERGLACTRHDYSGHGESGGVFIEGTISRWLSESLAVFRHFTTGRQILVGSSMGAWIALRMIEELHKAGEGARVCGLLLLAPAPDFTTELMEPKLTEEQRRALEEQGYIEEASEYSPEPNIYTRALFEDGRANRVLKGIIDTHCPVHILQGMVDPDVPYTHAMRLVEHLPADDVTLSLIRDGDHRLSRPQDIDLILRVTASLVDRCSG